MRKEDLETKRTIVRIWTSGHNPIHPGEDVGHVSIEIPSMQIEEHNLYISLWPRSGIGFEQVADTVPHRWHSLEDDLTKKGEGREPEVIYCFYTLDRHAMRDKFEGIKKTLQGWRLLGNLFVREQDTAESCASVAYKILHAGDTKEVLPSAVRQSSKLSSAGSSSTAGSSSSSGMFKNPVYSSELSSASVVASPDALVEILRIAKLREHEQESATKDITFPSETSVVVKRSWCSIM